MESEQLPLSPEHMQEEKLLKELQRKKKDLHAYDIPTDHLWVALIVSTTFVLYLKLHNDMYCERPVLVYSLQISGKDVITSGHV